MDLSHKGLRELIEPVDLERALSEAGYEISREIQFCCMPIIIDAHSGQTIGVIAWNQH